MEGPVQPGHDTVLILDFGSQYTQLIARRIREQGVYCEIRPCTDSPPESLSSRVKGLVLSGGPSSVYDDDAPPFDDAWLGLDLPVLGICYGMQLLARHSGGSVEQAERREYGFAELKTEANVLFEGVDQVTDVWMSHGDHVASAPEGWSVIGVSENCSVASMVNDAGNRFGLQFHPEVTHSRQGTTIIRNFIFDVCRASPDWTMGSFIEEQIHLIRNKVGQDHVICGMSGGVDSAVTAQLLHAAIGDQLHCIFVDNGVLRKNERAGVANEFQDLNLTVVDASDKFIQALAGVTEPERKRKIIGNLFIEVFEEEANKLVDTVGEIRWLAQGTLYPDVIESVSFKGPSATIKSHHNVGGLPDRMKMALIEPMRELFKDEVRALGLELNMSEERVFRQPFPGPGLAVRILGEVSSERVALLQEADAIVDEEIRAAGLYRELWQSFAALLPIKSVGVMGDSRTYEQTAVVRAVHSTDGMTASIAHLPWDLLERISSRIINEVRGINRVCYDISSKPPATIEWE
jgi:GMP synthase (glutamine-hydrolysing)